MDNLKIAIIQTPLHWENKGKNLNMLSAKIAQVEQDQDLMVLPEMFSTGFSMQPERFAEHMDGDSVTWLRRRAKQYNSVIAGSLIIKDLDSYRNRLIWMRPDGNYDYYDKRHLFRLANEQDHYVAGNKRKIVSLKEWRINLNICYDLRFPVWSRNNEDYDILLNVANWPAKRSHAWKTLLRARAIENMCYVIGLNRVGDDGNGFFHSGDSAIVHPDGTAIEACSVREKIIYASLSKEELLAYRDRFQFYKDRDTFVITTQSDNSESC